MTNERNPPRDELRAQASSAATNALFDRNEFCLDERQSNAFVAALDAPARHHARLEKLLREGSVFQSNWSNG